MIHSSILSYFSLISLLFFLILFIYLFRHQIVSGDTKEVIGVFYSFEDSSSRKIGGNLVLIEKYENV